MSDWKFAAKAAEIPDPGRAVVEVADRVLVLLHVGGEFFALDDVCTHDDGPLSEGKLADHALACPRHGAKFDIRTGAALTMPATQPTRSYRVQVVDGAVQVEIVD